MAEQFDPDAMIARFRKAKPEDEAGADLAWAPDAGGARKPRGALIAAATNAAGTSYGSIQSFAAAKLSQTITFEALANKTYADGPFDLSATASSGTLLFVGGPLIAAARAAAAGLVQPGCRRWRPPLDRRRPLALHRAPAQAGGSA